MEKDTSRIESFSDGVFAVAITLLAVEIGLDMRDFEGHHALEATTNDELWQRLIALWPRVLTYFNSFASVLLMWMAHHRVFKMLRTSNTALILSNGLLLLVIALVPLPTRTMGEFVFTHAFKAAVLFYTGYSVLVATVFVIFISTAQSAGERLLLPEVSPEMIKGFAGQLWTGMLLNLAIWILAFFFPLASLILNCCMWIFWAILSGTKFGEQNQ
jgi:uncharacterized membrane protein